MASKFATTVLVQRRNGNIYDLGKEGLRVVTFDVPSSSYSHSYTQIGSYGSMLSDTKTQQISIPLVFDVSADNYDDYEVQRLKVMRIFDSTEPFYVMSKFIPYIRWKVVAESFTYPRTANSWFARVSLTLTCYEGYGESIATTQNLMNDDFKPIGFGMNFPMELPSYTFVNQNRFNIYNAGMIKLLADQQHAAELIIKGDAPNGFKIINHTTEQEFEFKKPLIINDEFILKGLIPTVNGIQRLGNSWSSRSFLDYDTGNNDIEVVGLTNSTISFNTRFYY